MRQQQLNQSPIIQPPKIIGSSPGTNFFTSNKLNLNSSNYESEIKDYQHIQTNSTTPIAQSNQSAIKDKMQARQLGEYFQGSRLVKIKK